MGSQGLTGSTPRDAMHRQFFLSIAVLTGIAAGCNRSQDNAPTGPPATPVGQSPSAPRIPTVRKQAPKAPPLPANATLEQAYERLTNDADHKPYLRALRDQFREIELTPADAPPKWNTLTLNQQGARIDAIRFTSPPGQTSDLRWCFIHPRHAVKHWFI